MRIVLAAWCVKIGLKRVMCGIRPSSLIDRNNSFSRYAILISRTERKELIWSSLRCQNWTLEIVTCICTYKPLWQTVFVVVLIVCKDLPNSENPWVKQSSFWSFCERRVSLTSWSVLGLSSFDGQSWVKHSCIFFITRKITEIVGDITWRKIYPWPVAMFNWPKLKYKSVCMKRELISRSQLFKGLVNLSRGWVTESLSV